MTEQKNKAKRIKKRLVYISAILFAALIIAAYLAVYFAYFSDDLFSGSKATKITVDKQEARPGQELTYRIDLENSGNIPASDVIVRAKLPASTSLVSIASPVESTLFDEEEKTIMLNAFEIGPDEDVWVEFKVLVDSPLEDGYIIESGDVSVEYLARERKRSVSIKEGTKTLIDSAPHLTGLYIGMEDLNGFVPEAGDEVRFFITLENTGTMDARSIKIRNDIPEKITVEDDTIGQGGIYNPFNNTIDWEIVELEAGKKVLLEYNAILTKSFENIEAFTNVVKVTGGEYSDTAVYTARVLAHEDLSSSEVVVEDVNGGDAWAWDRLRYTMTIKNTGKVTARDFRLICPIPEGTGYIQDSATGDNYFFDQERNCLQWNLTGLAEGEVMDVSFDVNVGGYLTGGGYIQGEFTLVTERQEVPLNPEGIEIRPYAFQTIVLMGDSHITLNDWPETLAELLEITYPHAVFNIIESAVPGEMAVDAISRFDETVRVHNPDIIILGYGTNDAGAETGFFRHHMNILVQQAKSTGAEVMVYNIGYIDVRGTWSGKTNFRTFNKILKEDIAVPNDIYYIDLYGSFVKDPDTYIGDDGMHWTEEGEDLAADVIFKALYEVLDKDGRLKQ